MFTSTFHEYNSCVLFFAAYIWCRHPHVFFALFLLLLSTSNSPPLLTVGSKPTPLTPRTPPQHPNTLSISRPSTADSKILYMDGSALGGATLADLERQMNGVDFILVDEMSMIGQDLLGFTSIRAQQAVQGRTPELAKTSWVSPAFVSSRPCRVGRQTRMTNDNGTCSAV